MSLTDVDLGEAADENSAEKPATMCERFSWS